MAKSKSPTPAKLPRKTVTDATDKATLKCLEGEARSVYEDSIKDGKPELAAPVRSLGNVKYDSKVGYLEIGKQKEVRTLTVNTRLRPSRRGCSSRWPARAGPSSAARWRRCRG